MISTISVGRRPKRSAINPNRKAPTGRMARVINIASVTAETLDWNCVAMALTQKTRMKKSKASRAHPRKQAMNEFRCSGVGLGRWPINSILLGQVRFERARLQPSRECCGVTGGFSRRVPISRQVLRMLAYDFGQPAKTLANRQFRYHA